MRRGLVLALIGAVLIGAGIVALVLASDNHPISSFDPSRYYVPGRGSGWSSTAYDAVRVGGWALVVLGVLALARAVVRVPPRTIIGRGGKRSS